MWHEFLVPGITVPLWSMFSAIFQTGNNLSGVKNMFSPLGFQMSGFYCNRLSLNRTVFGTVRCHIINS
jgi:hypothetical protein